MKQWFQFKQAYHYQNLKRTCFGQNYLFSNYAIAMTIVPHREMLPFQVVLCSFIQLLFTDQHKKEQKMIPNCFETFIMSTSVQNKNRLYSCVSRTQSSLDLLHTNKSTECWRSRNKHLHNSSINLVHHIKLCLKFILLLP